MFYYPRCEYEFRQRYMNLSANVVWIGWYAGPLFNSMVTETAIVDVQHS